jgi:thiazole synthase ThiGH ThiG subunit
VAAGRQAFLAGRIPVRTQAIASSPTADVPQPAPVRG